MLTPLRRSLARSRLAVFRLLRSAAARVEPSDPAHLAGRLDRGEIVWRAFVDAGAALRRCGRFAEAEAMVERGLAVYPGDGRLLYEHALAAHNAGHYSVAIGRWTAALAATPDVAMCHCGLAANLRETGDLLDAEAVMRPALARFPDDLNVLSEAARIADARGRYGEALPLWSKAAASANPPAEWVRGEAHAMVQLGRFAEAEAVLERARARYPDDAGVAAVEGLLATARQDWPKAVALWTAYSRRFPDDGIGREHLGRAVQASQSSRSDKTEPQRQPEAVDADAVRGLLLGFESIGDNLEFGLVQRRFGAEPLGLLRWNNVTLDGLLPALADRFAGMGEPENTRLSTGENGEFLLEDRRWGLAMHTFLFAGQEDREALFAKMCRRVTFLRDKLLADLAAAEKVFVFRSSGQEGDRLEALHAALRAFGPVRLLSVQPAAPTAPTLFQGRAGDLMEIEAGRYVGFLERLGVTDGGVWDIAFDDWVSICRKLAPA